MHWCSGLVERATGEGLSNGNRTRMYLRFPLVLEGVLPELPVDSVSPYLVCCRHTFADGRLDNPSRAMAEERWGRCLCVPLLAVETGSCRFG